MPWQHFSFYFFGPPKILGRVWVPDLGPGWALAGSWPGLQKMRVWDMGGLGFVRAPNGKPPPWIDRDGPGDAKNLGFD